MARAKLGEILIQQGVIDASALKLALGAQIRFASQGMKIGQVLVDMGACTPEHVAHALGTQIGVPYSDLTAAQPHALAMLPIDLCARHHAVAIAYEAGPPEVVNVAFAEPLDLTAVDAVRSVLRKRVKAFIASPEAIAAKLASLGAASLEPVAPSSDRVDLGDVLFSDEGGGTLAIEHEEPGQLRVPGLVSMGEERSVDLGLGDDLFGRAPTPPPAEPIRGSTPLPTPAGVADFDSLFGPSPGGPRAPTPVPLESMPELEGTLLEGTVSPVLEGMDSVSLEDEGPPPTPVAIHHFADTRPPKPPKPKAPPAPAAAELSSEDLFGDEPAPEPAPAPLLGAEFAAETQPEAPSLAPALFGTASGHVGEHSDELPAPHEPAHRDHLFGEPHAHLSEHVSGEGLEATAESLSFGTAAPTIAPPESPTPMVEGPGEWDSPLSASPPIPAPIDEHVDLDFTDAEPIPEVPIAEAVPLPIEPPALLPVVEPPEPLPIPVAAPPEPLPLPEPEPEPIPAAPVSVPTDVASFALAPPAHPEAAASEPVDSLASFADRPLTEAEIEVINAIEQLADGVFEETQVKQVKPAQMVAALVRLLIRQGVIQETDFLAELSRK